MAIEEVTISQKIVSLLENDATLTDIKKVNFDRTRLAIESFEDWELPAIQLWDLRQQPTHVRGYVEVAWTVALEIIMKQTVAGEVSQEDLWDLRRRVELVLWDKPKLDIAPMIHLKYLNNNTDMHLNEPFYISRIEFDILFRRKLTGSC